MHSLVLQQVLLEYSTLEKQEQCISTGVHPNSWEMANRGFLGFVQPQESQYLLGLPGGSPGPRCEFPASKSLTNTEEM